MQLLPSSIALLAFVSGVVADRTITVYNACPFTIWPAVFTDKHAGGGIPNVETGWEAPAWSVKTFTAPENWRANRVWGRRNCDFSKGDVNSCLTGWCLGGLQCNPDFGTGNGPHTLAEFTLDSAIDNYDVSLVDGYNLPMRITNDKGCHVAECPVDLGPECPDKYKGPFDSNGFPVGCKNACIIETDANRQDSPACCTGSHASGPQSCPPSGVPDYNFFKSRCPNAYAYAYDEPSGTALWTCPGNLHASYTITFCPPP